MQVREPSVSLSLEPSLDINEGLRALLHPLDKAKKSVYNNKRTRSPGSMAWKIMKKHERMTLFSGTVKAQQRLAAILLALLKKQYDNGIFVCPCGKRQDMKTGTLDIHHIQEGSGPVEREQYKEHYYAVLASRFLWDLVGIRPKNSKDSYFQDYELICRECHESRHGNFSCD